MTRYGKLLASLLSGAVDQSLRCDDVCGLLRRLGFVERRRGGSHRIFSREGVAEILNLQPRAGGVAKAYQVKQVREIILRYQLADRLLDAAERNDDES